MVCQLAKRVPVFAKALGIEFVNSSEELRTVFRADLTTGSRCDLENLGLALVGVEEAFLDYLNNNGADKLTKDQVQRMGC